MEEQKEQMIQRMSDVLASQVAAGEVVERPSSVVKELVENSIDAGATSVRVEIRRGGVAMIKVTDNGRGMSRADAWLCLERHATSKLTDVADLFAIRQLGFRGEALPSIASVSDTRITTRRPQDVEGTLVCCAGGIRQEVMNAGCAPGTEICVMNLFFNTPVRRKFLKSDDTEAGHVEHQLKLHALAFPGVRFTLLRDGQTLFDVPATTDVRRRIADLFGRETAEQLLRIRPTDGPGVRAEGFLMPLSEARRNRRLQFVFLNGRPIEDKTVIRAVRDGYGGFPTGLHPSLFLYLEVDPGLVDVNVHPAKREVRFRRQSDVTNCIIQAVAGTLSEFAKGETASPSRSSSLQPSVTPPSSAAMSALRSRMPDGTAENEEDAPLPPRGKSASADSPLPQRRPEPFRLLRPVLSPRQQEMELPPVQPRQAVSEILPPPPPQGRDESVLPCVSLAEPDVPGFRFLGILRERYILMENKEGIVLFSPRAARERIVFEKLLESNRHPLPSQRLLTPVLLELDARDFGMAEELLPLMGQVGFLLSAFGRNTLRIEGVPLLLKLDQVGDFLHDFIRLFSEGEARLKRGRSPFEPFAVQLARHYVQGEDTQSWFSRPMVLLCDLLRCEIPYCTPTGKPTMVPVSLNEINRKFSAR